MLFVKPPLEIYQSIPFTRDMGKKGISHATYAEYNYLAPGLASKIRTQHFETCLRLTSKYFGDSHAIDFGCADGVLLPSLSKYYHSVVGIDRQQYMIDASRIAVEKLGLSNITLLCNADLSFELLKERLPEKRYRVLYLLETLEHIGEREDPWESRVEFLKKLSGLIEREGVLVVSVPKMVGPAFLIQRLGLALVNAHRASISLAETLKAGLLYNTSELERRWEGDHLGFNHIKLEKAMKREFRSVKKVDLPFQAVYLLTGHS